MFSLTRAITDFILSSQRPDGGFPPLLGEESTSITTTQVLSAMHDLHIDWQQPQADRALLYLLNHQQSSGKWSHSLDDWETSNTAWCFSGLTKTLPRRVGEPIRRGVAWLRSMQTSGGGFSQSESIREPNTYATAYAIRALHHYQPGSNAVRTAITWLHSVQNPDGGFGLLPNQPSEACKTAYVLHGLIDAEATLEQPVIRRAVDWLLRAQRNDGSWTYWTGINDSPEGAVLVSYVLIRLGVRNPALNRAFSFLQDYCTIGFPIDGKPSIWLATFALQTHASLSF